MNKSFVWIVAVCVGIVRHWCAGPEEKAGKLLAEASQLVHSAQEAEKISYPDALKLYQEGLTKAEAIPAQYPSTQLAGKIAQDEAKIGPYTLAELKGTIVPRAQIKAEAEESPLACALLVAGTIGDTNSRANTVAEIATKYADVGQLDRVLQILKTTKDKESRNRVLSAMVSKYLNPDHYDLALRIANSVKDSAQKDWALAWIARDAVGHGLYDKALEVTHMLEGADSKAEGLIGVAGGCAQAGQKEKVMGILSQALEVTKTIEDTSREDWALGQVARGYAAVGQYDQALEVTGKMGEFEEKTETLAEIARQHMKAGHYDQAITVAHLIADPSAQYRTLAEIADTYIVSGDKAKIRELLAQLLQVANAIQERPLLEGRIGRTFLMGRSPIDAMQYRPIKARALAEVAGKYAKLGEKEQAAELLSQAVKAAIAVTDALRKADTLVEIAGGYAELGQFDQALQIVGTIQEAYFKGRALVVIAGKYTQADQFDRALQVTEAIEEPGLRSDALAVIVHRYVEAGQYDRALQLAQTMANDRVRQGVLADIANGYAKAGQQEEAASLLSESKDGREAYWQSEAEEKAETIAGMARMYAEAGLYDPALQIATVIGDISEKAGALSDVAQKFAEVGQKEKAAEVLFQTLEAAKAVEEKTDPALNMISDIALRYADIGQCHQAAEAAKLISEAQSREQTVAEIAAKCETGQQEKAITTPEEKTEPAITGIHAETDQYDQALQATRVMEDTSDKAEALLAIAHKYAEAGAEEKATEIFFQALQLANSIEDPWNPWVKVGVLTLIAGKYIEAGQYDQALTITRTMKDDTPKTGVLAEVASKYAEAGAQEKAAELLSQALQIAKTKEGAEAKAQALMAIGLPYTKAGLKVDDNARKMLHDLIAELGESVWRKQPSETEEQKPGRRRMWGIVGADGNP